MKIIRSFTGRRQFLATLTGSAFLLGLRKHAKAFDFFFQQSNAKTADNTNSSGNKPLKGIVVYYSATGSTEKVAKAIHRGMKSVMDCDYAKLKNADPKKMANYDVIGIGGPIWYFRETANLKLFIHNMPQLDGKLCFPFCTHGSDPAGYMYSIIRSLLKRALTIIGWHDWYGSVYHVLHMPKPYLTDGHPDAIDLQEAEAFGREMAERAQRIAAGEKALIPEIPTGTEADADQLWVRHYVGEPMPTPTPGASGGPAPTPGPNPLPKINLAACVYPRCDACADTCPAGAIDFALISPGKSASELLIKEACLSCALCERVCSYDAATFDGGKTKHVIDMTRCTYPKCTLCADHCPMKSIDLSMKPPVFHHNCEGCDLCWCVCPKDAISIPNLAETHARGRMRPNHPFIRVLAEAEAKGKFRRLVPMDKVGFETPIFLNKNVPRIVLNEDEETTYCANPCKL